MTRHPADPDQYVRENHDLLVRIIRHGDDPFVRALALSALVHYGDDPELYELERDLGLAREVMS